MLSLLRIMTWHEILVPFVISITSLTVIWMEEETLPHQVANFLLTLSILLQVVLYQAHIGLFLALIVGMLGIAYVWHKEALRGLGPRLKTLHIPAFIRTRIAHARSRAGTTLTNAARRVTTGSRAGPSRLRRGKAGGR